MDFTMNMIESERIGSSQSNGLTTIGGYHTHQVNSIPTSHQQARENLNSVTPHLISISQSSHPQTHQVVTVSATPHHQHDGTHLNHQQHSLTTHQIQIHGVHEDEISIDSKLRDFPKNENIEAFTPPPPRVSSRGSSNSHILDTTVEKGTDTNDFDPYIKIEIRGHLPGFTSADRDKNSVMQIYFNSVSEVIHFFSQRSIPQIEAFNILAANPDLVRNINPDLVRNHFLYVPANAATQEPIRVSSNGLVTSGNTINQPITLQTAAGNSQIIQIANSIPTVTVAPKPKLKTERRRGEVPPGTIINKCPPIQHNPNQFVCWICGINLHKSLPFEEHMVEHHSIEKPYRCDDCGVTFKQKAHIDRHKRIHLPTRPYQCGVCGKGFTRNEHVRRHAFTHSGEKPYSCPTCSKSFARQQQLTKHLMTHTKLPRPDSPQMMHPHAGLTTTLLLQATDQNGRLVTINPASLPAAMLQSQTATIVTAPAPQQCNSRPIGKGRGLLPNGEPVPRPYQCGVCGKAFIRNEHLRRHMLIHSGEKPHVCNICGSAFPRREHLSKHIKTNHKEVTVQASSTGSNSSIPAQITLHTTSSISNSISSPIQSSLHSTISGLPGGLSVVTSNPNSQTPLPAHSGSVTHTIPTSHASPGSHSTHLPPGTHYLPLFNLMAEVV